MSNAAFHATFHASIHVRCPTLEQCHRIAEAFPAGEPFDARSGSGPELFDAQSLDAPVVESVSVRHTPILDALDALRMLAPLVEDDYFPDCCTPEYRAAVAAMRSALGDPTPATQRHPNAHQEPRP